MLEYIAGLFANDPLWVPLAVMTGHLMGMVSIVSILRRYKAPLLGHPFLVAFGILLLMCFVTTATSVLFRLAA